jgi:hypothetical protein
MTEQRPPQSIKYLCNSNSLKLLQDQFPEHEFEAAQYVPKGYILVVDSAKTLKFVERREEYRPNLYQRLRSRLPYRISKYADRLYDLHTRYDDHWFAFRYWVECMWWSAKQRWKS